MAARGGTLIYDRTTAHHRLHQRFKLLWIRSVARDYAEQRVLLDKFFEQTGADVVVGSYVPIQENNGGPVQTGSVWVEGAHALLPKTDLVGFFRLAPGGYHKLVAEGEWQRVCQVVGHLMERTDHYPERYRVKGFPSPEELKAIRMESRY